MTNEDVYRVNLQSIMFFERIAPKGDFPPMGENSLEKRIVKNSSL